MTHAELKEAVRILIGDELATRFKDKSITEAANGVIRYLWQRTKTRNPDWAQKSYAFSTSIIQSDPRRYALPADYGTLTLLEYTADKASLAPWDWPREQESLTDGKPWWYRIEKGYLVLDPKPDAIYAMTLHYEYIIPRLSADADVHALPEFFDEVIKLKTAVMLGADLDRGEIGNLEASMLAEMSASPRFQAVGGLR